MVYQADFQLKLQHQLQSDLIAFVASDLVQRTAMHCVNRSARLLTVLNNGGINCPVVKVTLKAERTLKRKPKNYKKSRCFCQVRLAKA